MSGPDARRRAALFFWMGLLVTALIRPPGSLAQGQALESKLTGRELVGALTRGGYVILLRHTATDSFVPDPNAFDLEDCATQRNLSEEGRQQAKLIGRSFAKLGIEVGQVLTSPYCRCVDTGTLAFGEVVKSEVLSVGDALPPEEKDARGAKIREMLGTQPAAGKNTVLITHTGNLLYAFGLQARPEGIAHVFQPSEFGPAVYVGKVVPEEWSTLAGIEPQAP